MFKISECGVCKKSFDCQISIAGLLALLAFVAAVRWLVAKLLLHPQIKGRIILDCR